MRLGGTLLGDNHWEQLAPGLKGGVGVKGTVCRALGLLFLKQRSAQKFKVTNVLAVEQNTLAPKKLFKMKMVARQHLPVWLDTTHIFLF